MSERRKVVVTGAAGLIAGHLLPFFHERYDLTLLDVRTTNRQGNEVEGLQIADLIDKDRDAYRGYFRGADAVVHLGFTRDQASIDADFAAEMANVQMAYNVYHVCLEEKIRRVVVTSSNHAADYYEDLILDHRHDPISAQNQNRSYAFYGWAKDVYEHLGFVFALGKQTGTPLENVQIRIGGPRENDIERLELGDLRQMRRALAVYISKRDLAQLYIKSIETEDIRDQFGVPFQIFYGISGNSHAFWSIVNAREVIGYEPEDNSEHRFRELIQKHIVAAEGKD